ncbi:MAG: ThuA domain-containing protein [Planctomycetaceae bacterium]
MRIVRLPAVALLPALALGILSLWKSLPVRADEPAKKARILMVTTSKTFTHQPVKREKDRLAAAEVAVTQLGQQTGLFTVDCTQDPVRDFTPENLKNYDIVFFYTQGPDLEIPKSTLEYFLNTWLKQKGHGFIGTHSATDTYGEYQPYWDMVGGSFNGHPWTSNMTVSISVHDTQHPASRPWGTEFSINDEIYQYKNWQPDKVRVLMSLNMAKCDLKKPYHVPVAWVKEYGEGRVFCTNLGHNSETWANRQFLDSLAGGVRWVLGRESGSAVPNPELSRAQEAKAKSDAGEGK